MGAGDLGDEIEDFPATGHEMDGNSWQDSLGTSSSSQEAGKWCPWVQRFLLKPLTWMSSPRGPEHDGSNGVGPPRAGDRVLQGPLQSLGVGHFCVSTSWRGVVPSELKADGTDPHTSQAEASIALRSV